MSNIPGSEPYPSDQYLVDQIHSKVEKDLAEAALLSHNWFGFGVNHGASVENTYYPDETIISSAVAAPITSIGYVKGVPTSITYTDTTDFTSNSQSITYTTGVPTQIIHTFTFNSMDWTVTVDITYSAGLPATKTISIVKV